MHEIAKDGKKKLVKIVSVDPGKWRRETRAMHKSTGILIIFGWTLETADL